MGFAAPALMVESEPAASLVVIDGDPGVVAGLTSELEHRYVPETILRWHRELVSLSNSP